MKQTLFLIASTFFLFSCGNEAPKEKKAEQSQAKQVKNESDWVSLFNGKTFDGWHVFNMDKVTSEWSIEDGYMIFTPKKGDSKGGKDLISDKEYTNFELSLEWNISEGGNSGVFWGIKEGGKYDVPYVTGPEIQVLDNERHPDAKNNPKYHQRNWIGSYQGKKSS